MAAGLQYCGVDGAQLVQINSSCRVLWSSVGLRHSGAQRFRDDHGGQREKRW